MFKSSIIQAAATVCGQKAVGVCHGSSPSMFLWTLLVMKVAEVKFRHGLIKCSGKPIGGSREGDETIYKLC